MIRVSELRNREVVNVNDGRRLGLIEDLDLDLERGAVRAITIPATGGIWKKVVRSRDYEIPWGKIVKIGVDTILVDFPVDQYTRPANR